MKRIVSVVAVGVVGALVWAQDKPEGKAPAGKAPVATADSAKSPLDFTMKTIDGADVPLAKYRGEVVLIVNVASKCGLTPQYEDLQKLHEKYGPQGLRILGFPANNFGSQEPGTNAEIKEFCSTKYGVGFDMFAKVSVKGDDTCELYKYLTGEKSDPGHAGEIKWNFTKFLIGRDGQVVARFEPKVKPLEADMTKAIEQALAQPKPAVKPAGGASAPQHGG